MTLEIHHGVACIHHDRDHDHSRNQTLQSPHDYSHFQSLPA
jgi:hypothetical protein